MTNPDYVYYLIVDGEMLMEHIFSSEEKLTRFAQENEITNYQIRAWNVA